MRRWLVFTRCFVTLAAILIGDGPVTSLTRANSSGTAIGTEETQGTWRRQRPNIVLIFPDNLGWGEVGVYGSVRGVPTPRH